MIPLLKKNKPISKKEMGLFFYKNPGARLDFGHGDSALRTYFYTGLTAEAFICLYWLCFTVNHLENLSRASCYTLFVAAALIFVNYYFKHDVPP
jgi:hypothetical protein